MCLFNWKSELHKERKRDRERSCISWFVLQMVVMAWAWPKPEARCYIQVSHGYRGPSSCTLFSCFSQAFSREPDQKHSG